MFKLVYLPSGILLKRLVSGLFFILAMYMFKHGQMNKSIGKSGFCPQYIRPPRRFAPAAFDADMKYCNSRQRYLRPTLYCNPHANQIIAMAHYLGAYKKPDRDFAESAFEFVKRSITIELIPLDSAEKTLERGTGTCLHKLSLMIALCRAAGIKARYKLYTLTSTDTLGETLGGNHLADQWYKKMGTLLFHGEVEVYIDGQWIVGSLGLSDERQASLNLPITRFGEVALGVWYSADPESIIQLESIPYGLNTVMKIAYKMAPAAIDKANANLLKQCKLGKAILDEKGEHAYDLRARQLFRQRMPESIMTGKQEITFIN